MRSDSKPHSVTMIPRVTPLCLPHFAQYVNETISSGSKLEQLGIKVKLALTPTRVQPSRRANKKLNYSEDDHKKIGKKSAKWMRMTDDSLKANFADVSATSDYCHVIQTLLEELSHEWKRGNPTKSSCNFGPRIWNCVECEQEKLEESFRKLEAWKMETEQMVENKGIAPEAVMEPGIVPMGEVSSSWHDVVVPAKGRFRLGEQSFALDVCGEAMVIML